MIQLDIAGINQSIENDFYAHMILNSHMKMHEFKDLADAYFSMKSIPYMKDSSGSGIRYHCPLSKDCSFEVYAAKQRSKKAQNNSVVLRTLSLAHTCGYDSKDKSELHSVYRQTYKKRKNNVEQNPIPESSMMNEEIPLTAHIPIVKDTEEYTNNDYSLFNTKTDTRKRIKMCDQLVVSKRSCYGHTAYIRILIRNVLMMDPSSPSKSIYSIIQEFSKECKESTVNRIIEEERKKFLTPFKDMMNALLRIQDQMIQANKDNLVYIQVENDSIFGSAFLYPAESASILQHSKHVIAIDCTMLQGYCEGVVYHASTCDGDMNPILLAYMIAVEETTTNWRQFADLLVRVGVLNQEEREYTRIIQLCDAFERQYASFAEPQTNMIQKMKERKAKTNESMKNSHSSLIRYLFTLDYSLHDELYPLLDKSDLPMCSIFNQNNLCRSCNDEEYGNLRSNCSKSTQQVYLYDYFVQFMMIDDVFTSLYHIMNEVSMTRLKKYKDCNEKDQTAYYCQVLQQYCENESDTVRYCSNEEYELKCDPNCSEKSVIVNLVTKECSCGFWSLYGIPCIHAWKVMKKVNPSLLRDSCDTYYTYGNVKKMIVSYSCPRFDRPFEKQIEYARIQFKKQNELPEECSVSI